MDSLPEEAFEHPPAEDDPEEGLGDNFGAGTGGLAMTDTLAKQQYLAPTENALQVAGANPKVQQKSKPGKGPAAGGSGGRNALIPGPPPPPPPTDVKPGPPPPLPTKNLPPMPAPAALPEDIAAMPGD